MHKKFGIGYILLEQLENIFGNLLKLDFRSSLVTIKKFTTILRFRLVTHWLINKGLTYPNCTVIGCTPF